MGSIFTYRVASVGTMLTRMPAVVRFTWVAAVRILTSVQSVNMVTER